MRHKFCTISSSILILILLIIGFDKSLAQSNINLKGTVINADERFAIVGAEVQLISTGNRTITDINGRYSFANIVEGEYQVSIKALGYEEYVSQFLDISSSVTTLHNVSLSSELTYVGTIKVKGRREKVSSKKSDLIFRKDIEASSASDLPELLETIPGLQIQQANVAGSRVHLKIRGAASDQVLILIDGHKINSSGDGTADLGMIPLALIERIEVHKGGSSSEFGPDALGGVVNIITRSSVLSADLELNTKFRSGKWKSNFFDITASNIAGTDKFSAKAAYNQGRSDGNFAYKYKIGENLHEGVRLNNRFKSTNYFMSGIYQPNSNYRLIFSGQYFLSERGMPDRASRQNLYAYSDDNRLIANGSAIRSFGDNGELKFDLSFSRFDQSFIDTAVLIDSVYIDDTIIYDTIPRTHFHSNFTNDIFTIKLSGKSLHNENNTVSFGAEFKRDLLFHDNFIQPRMSMGKTSRNSLGIYASEEWLIDLGAFKIIDDAVLDGSLRFDYSAVQKDSTSWLDTAKSSSVSIWSPRIGIALHKGDDWSYIFRSSYGHSFRLPTLNALFWQGDVMAHGNPGLFPEKSEHSEVGIELTGKWASVNLKTGINYYHAVISDAIAWTSRLGAWQPTNLSRVRSFGHEDYIELNLFDNLITLKYQNSINSSTIKSDEYTLNNKYLTFSPHYTTDISISLNWKNFEADYSVRMVDSAYTLMTNTKYYDSYRLDNLHLGFKYDYKSNWKFRLDYKINNIYDQSYVLLTHYPMPGREWNIGFNLTYIR